ncbi:MAG: hypothetical protein KGI51_06170 [Rhodospirillales bacterium]|nr:hypothetical protein [Rhodospirillales bacterium]
MSRLPSLLRRAKPEPEAEAIPPARLAQVYAVLRRRVSDTVEDAFGRACLAGDVATARDLVIVMERMITRGTHLPGGERRHLSGTLQRLRIELERCAALQDGTGTVTG